MKERRRFDRPPLPQSLQMMIDGISRPSPSFNHLPGDEPLVQTREMYRVIFRDFLLDGISAEEILDRFSNHRVFRSEDDPG